MTKRSRAREVALQLLFQHDFNPKVKRAQRKRFARDRLNDLANETFCLSLYDGVMGHVEDVDRRLSEAADNWRLVRMSGVDRNVLRLGAYEVLFAPDTPPSVALNEAIELARRFGAAESPAFVNGVLDKLVKIRDQAAATPEPASTTPEPAAVSSPPAPEAAAATAAAVTPTPEPSPE